MNSDESIPVEYGGHHLIIADKDQLSNGFYNVGVRAWTCLSASSTWHAKLAVNSTLPMNDQRYVTSIDIDVDNNFLDEGADDALL